MPHQLLRHALIHGPRDLARGVDVRSLRQARRRVVARRDGLLACMRQDALFEGGAARVHGRRADADIRGARMAQLLAGGEGLRAQAAVLRRGEARDGEGGAGGRVDHVVDGT